MARAGRRRAREDIDPATGKPRLHGGFYTQDQVRDIVALCGRAPHHRRSRDRDARTCERRGRRVSASSASPTNQPKAVPSDWGVYPTLFNVDESTFTFLEDVLDRSHASSFPSAIHSRRRRRGRERRVAGVAARPGAHEGTRREGRARAAGLFHPAHRKVPQRARAASSSAGTRSSKAVSRRTPR